jgi:hypothetical protein
MFASSHFERRFRAPRRLLQMTSQRPRAMTLQSLDMLDSQGNMALQQHNMSACSERATCSKARKSKFAPAVKCGCSGQHTNSIHNHQKCKNKIRQEAASKNQAPRMLPKK